MTFDGNGGEMVPPKRDIPHYHGGEVRTIFVVAALVLFVSQSIGLDLPLSTSGSVFGAVLLVVLAGITNPAGGFIHWINEGVAVYATFLFGMAAVNHFQSGTSVFDVTFVATEILALLSLLALYYTTRTIRGIIQRPSRP